MPECSEIGLMLGAVGDGELEPNDLQEVARHVERCASCTGALSDYSTIGRELREIAVKPSLEGFTKSVLDVIAKLVAVALLLIALHSVIVGPGSVNVARSLPETVARTQPAAPTRLVDVRVDSAFVADANSGAFSHTDGRTQSGKMLVFNLPGGKTLHVMPRAIAGNMIAMQVVLFDGNQTAMTAEMKLESGDTFALSGEKYGEGTLLIRISPTTASNDNETPRSQQAS
jgi:Putative zinc-finger